MWPHREPTSDGEGVRELFGLRCLGMGEVRRRAPGCGAARAEGTWPSAEGFWVVPSAWLPMTGFIRSDDMFLDEARSEDMGGGAGPRRRTVCEAAVWAKK